MDFELDSDLQRAIIANMFAGVALVRVADGTFLYTNSRYAAIFGYEPDELEGKPVAIVNAPGDETPEQVAADIMERLKAESVWSGEIRNVRKDGVPIWCHANVTTFEHARFGPVWVVVQEDITARRVAEEERRTAHEQRRKSEARLNLVLDALEAGAWDWNVPTGEVYYSPVWCRALGYAPEDVPPHVSFWENLVHPDDMPRVRAALSEHFQGVTDRYEVVVRLRRKNGEWQWDLDRGRVVERTASGEPLRMVGADTDLSTQSWSGLQPIVTICAGCKKIRNEANRWESLEQHFGARSLARFSHGLCPDCIRMYSMDSPE